MKSKMQKELVEATGLKPKEGESRQKFLRRLVAAAQAIKESDWDALSTPAQRWVNAGQAVLNDGDADDEIKDFKDYTPPADEAEDEEEAAPAKKKKKPADDEDADEPAEDADEPTEDEEENEKEIKKKKGKAKAEPDDDEDEPPKKKSAKKKAEPEAEEEEEDEVEKKGKKAVKKVAAKKTAEKPAKTAKKAAKKERDLTVSGTKFDITKAVIKNPKLTAADIFEKLGGKKAGISEITVAAVRANVRHTLQSLVQLELLEIEL